MSAWGIVSDKVMFGTGKMPILLVYIINFDGFERTRIRVNSAKP